MTTSIKLDLPNLLVRQTNIKYFYTELYRHYSIFPSQDFLFQFEDFFIMFLKTLKNPQGNIKKTSRETKNIEKHCIESLIFMVIDKSF